MAVAFDAVGPSSAGSNSAISATSGTAGWSHTCSGTNRILIVGIAVGAGVNDGTSAFSVTYNGVAMTSLGKVHNNNDQLGFVQLFGLINPPTGPNNVSVNWTGADTASGQLNAGSISFTGCDQTTGWGTAVTAFGNGTTPSCVVAAATGDYVVDVVGTGTGVTSSTQTNKWLSNGNSFSGGGNGAGSIAAGATSVTMQYTVGTDFWGIIGVRILAASAAAAPIPNINMAVQR